MARRDVQVESQQSTREEEEELEIAAEGVVSSYPASASPPVQPDLIPLVSSTDIQDAIEGNQVIYSGWFREREALRGITLHHYHDGDDCIYAVVDERPARSRSKKLDTVLIIIQENKSTPDSSAKKYFVRYPDAVEKKESERWWLLDRFVTAEIVSRFRPSKVQHYVHADQCPNEACKCVRDQGLTYGYCKQLHVKQRDECKYGSKLDEREPGRGFYVNEQKKSGSVWQ